MLTVCSNTYKQYCRWMMTEWSFKTNVDDNTKRSMLLDNIEPLALIWYVACFYFIKGSDDCFYLFFVFFLSFPSWNNFFLVKLFPFLPLRSLKTLSAYQAIHYRFLFDFQLWLLLLLLTMLVKRWLVLFRFKLTSRNEGKKKTNCFFKWIFCKCFFDDLSLIGVYRTEFSLAQGYECS